MSRHTRGGRGKLPYLFTFILEFEGGTYISQRQAQSPEEAFGDWNKRMVVDEIASGASLAVAEAFKDWESARLVPIQGLTNVWCTGGSSDYPHTLLNIVQTDG